MTDERASERRDGDGRDAPALQRQTAKRTIRLGYLGPIVVLIGVAAAVVALWFMRTQRPVPGEEIDRFAIGPERTLIVRHEATSERSFVELQVGDTVKWRALVPPYAGAKGRPALAWSDKAVTVRVSRNGRAEVFAFAMDTAHKLGAFRLAPEHEPITTHAHGPITLTDHARGYELVGGPGWNQLIAIDLVRGGGAWKVDLGADPVSDAGLSDGEIWVMQGSKRRAFDLEHGTER
jgi:hypothetical protein